MNDVDRCAYFEGDLPASIRSLLDAVLDPEPPRPTAEAKARVMAKGLAAIDARLARMEEGGVEEEQDALEDDERDSAPPPLVPPAPVAPAVPAPSVDEVRARARGVAPLGFAGWALLSIHFIGTSAAFQMEALLARGLTLEDWRRIDEDYLQVMSADLRAGRRERPELYAAACDAEVKWRVQAEGAPVPVRPVVRQAPAAFTGTADPVALSSAVMASMGRMPFREASPGPPDPGMGVHGVTKTQASPVVPSGLGQTMACGDDRMQQALVGAMPFAGSAGGQGAVWFPRLTVPQFVALCAELAANPAGAAATLQRYGVPSEGAWWAMAEHWRRLLVERPAVRAEYDAAVVTYEGWRMAVAR